MINVKVGSTNYNGAGSAANLSQKHTVYTDSNLANSDTESVHESHFHAFYSQEYNTAYIFASEWNTAGAKEAKVELIDKNISLDNFVDVDVNGQLSTADIAVSVYNAKRGEIDTGSGNDHITLTIKSNNAGWSNHFAIDSGMGDDYISFSHGENSQYSNWYIDSGEGNDQIFLYSIEANTSNLQREIHAGAGDDYILGSQGDDTIDGGSGIDFIYSEGGNDIINGGQGADSIEAGSGDDVIFFDADDTFLSGGDGFDALITSGTGAIDISFREIEQNEYFYFSEFELIKGEKGSSQQVHLDFSDGLVVALGGDEGDAISFSWMEHAEVTASDAQYSNAEFLAAHDVDSANLQAYDITLFDQQYTIYTDSELTIA